MCAFMKNRHEQIRSHAPINYTKTNWCPKKNTKMTKAAPIDVTQCRMYPSSDANIIEFHFHNDRVLLFASRDFCCWKQTKTESTTRF